MALPNYITPGGGILQAMRAVNAFSDEGLKNRQQQLINQYYGPKSEADIAQSQASTNRSNQMLPLDVQAAQITNKFLEPLKQQALVQAQQQNQFYPDIARANIASSQAGTNKINQLLPGEVKQQEINTQYLPDKLKAEIASANAMADYRKMGGGRGAMGVGQKELVGFQNQIQMDHPEWDAQTVNQAANAYLTGEDALPDGTQLPKLSGLANQTRAQIYKRSSSAAIQNQAANMDITADELNAIDITPVMAFAGPKGKIRYAEEAASMARGAPVSEDFRKYESFKNITSTFAMDTMRKGFGTSVVPEYVYATLGKASNPNSAWWHDPEQVKRDWDTTKKWINRNAETLKTKAQFGATAKLGEEKKSTGKKWVYNQTTGKLEPK